MRPRLLSALSIVALAVAVDQGIKRLVVDTMGLGEAIEVLPFLALFHARNEGIAFSMLDGFHGLGLAAISVVVLGFVGWLWWNTPADRKLTQFGFAIIVGGAIGNLIDRVSLGYVVDYILFHTPVWSFAVFNLADTFISVGAALILLDEFVLHRKKRDAEGGKTADS
ncbi:signal peptidase II [Aureimonas sp. Leaf324]|uniref:signal peptidase II n=1 Tax=Aureimonas sp. Leaf324 TaxID=1736336 RepID=UPI0006F89C97|nr:signal peptidase II [Aureimonas sp. Leaf324]KQQ78895.1 lipoprotein signal peptidase [Aureimonas sp. Leaf324]